MNPTTAPPEHVTRPNSGSGEKKTETAMSMEAEIERDIVEYLCAQCGVEPDEITDDSTLNDLGLDSLGVAVIADIVDNKYGVSLDDERVAKVRTFSDLRDFVVLKVGEAHQRARILADRSSSEATSA